MRLNKIKGIYIFVSVIFGCAEGESLIPDVTNEILPQELDSIFEEESENELQDGEDDMDVEFSYIEEIDIMDSLIEDESLTEDFLPLDGDADLLDADIVDSIDSFDMEPEPDSFDMEPEPDLPWGETFCGRSASAPDCGVFCISPATYTDSVTLPSLGPGKVVELTINIRPRYILGMIQPFDDLEVSLSSPSGSRRIFWKRFYGGNSWDSSYSFTSSWRIPAFWDQNFSGTWSLRVEDYMWTGAATTIDSWCLRPLDPSMFSTTDTGAHISACWSGSHAITDYCDGDPPDPCTTHPISAEMNVADIVVAGVAPILTANITHPDPSELEIVLTSSGGRSVTVWNRASGPLPSFFTVSSLVGEWMTGRWSLTIEDNREGNVGRLDGWCIEVN